MTEATRNLGELPNLGKTTLMWLRAIGIRTRDSLAQKGVFWAYVEMRNRGFRVTNAVLFSLEGALRNVPWRSLNTQDKKALLADLAAYEQQRMGKQAALSDNQDQAEGIAAPKRAEPRAAGRHSSSQSPKRQRDLYRELS